MLLKLVFFAAAITGFATSKSTGKPIPIHQQLLVIVVGRVSTGITRIVAHHRGSSQLLLLLLLLLHQEHFALAQIAPYPLRGQVHVDAMGAVRLEVGRTVVVVLLRAANVETIFLQTYPQVWTVGVALRTWFTLLEFAQLDQREMNNIVQMRTLAAPTSSHRSFSSLRLVCALLSRWGFPLSVLQVFLSLYVYVEITLVCLSHATHDSTTVANQSVQTLSRGKTSTKNLCNLHSLAVLFLLLLFRLLQLCHRID